MDRRHIPANQVLPQWDWNPPENKNVDEKSTVSSVGYNILNFGQQQVKKDQYPTQYQEDYGKNFKQYANDNDAAYQTYDALNMVRTQPQSFVPLLQDMLRHFKGNVYTDPKTGMSIETSEGPQAVHEAINFLKHQAPLPPVTPTLGMSYAAEDHADDIGGKGLTSHNGSKGSKFADRLNQFGDFKGKVGQLMSFGFTDGKDLIKQLVIDDGSPDRQSRKQIFDKMMKNVGVGVADHNGYDNCGVLNYAENYQDKPGIQAKRKPRNQAAYQDNVQDMQSVYDELHAKNKAMQDRDMAERLRLQAEQEAALRERELALRGDALKRQQEAQEAALREKQRMLDLQEQRLRDEELRKKQNQMEADFLMRQAELERKERELQQQQNEKLRMLELQEAEMKRLAEEKRLQAEHDRLMFEEEKRRMEEEEYLKNQKYTHYTMRSAGVASKEDNKGKDKVLISDVRQFGEKYTSSEFNPRAKDYDPDRPPNAIDASVNKIWDTDNQGNKILIVKKTYIFKDGDVKIIRRQYKDGVLMK